MSTGIKKIIVLAVGVVLIGIAVVVGLKLIPPEKPVLELAEEILPRPAEEILAENIQKTLALTSFKSRGGKSVQIKQGEVVLFELVLEDFEYTVVDFWDIAQQDSQVAFNAHMTSFLAQKVDFIEEIVAPEALPAAQEALAKLRTLGEVTISVAAEMKTIDFDSYAKISAITGLEILSDRMRAIGEMEIKTREAREAIEKMEDAIKTMKTQKADLIKRWRKMPADPAMKEIAITVGKGVQGFTEVIYGAYYLEEVLPDTRINGRAVYNFVVSLNLDQVKKGWMEELKDMAEKMLGVMGKGLVEPITVRITEKWPGIKKIIEEAVETNERWSICQETYYTLHGTKEITIDIHRFVVGLNELLEEEVKTAVELEVLRNIHLLITVQARFSNHNLLLAIYPPEEYEVLEIPIPLVPPMPPMGELQTPAYDIA